MLCLAADALRLETLIGHQPHTYSEGFLFGLYNSIVTLLLYKHSNFWCVELGVSPLALLSSLEDLVHPVGNCMREIQIHF